MIQEDREWIICVTGLTKYFDRKCVVDRLDMKVRRGEIFGFLGPNGSGKTTTLRMLCGLLQPDAGEGTCLGFNVITEQEKIKPKIGYMTQRFSYYQELSVYENLDFVARVYNLADRKQKIQATLERFGLKSRQSQLAGELSGGWQQRLALAASLLHQPELLLLDEPTAGVDPRARRDFWDQIHDLSLEGITTLVSTHYMDEAERCTRLAYISFGRKLVEGTYDEVIAHVKLTTWMIQGPKLAELATQLRKLPGIEQAVLFGQTLHVSGSNEILMLQSLAPFQAVKEYSWQKITPSLEDAFISLAGKVKEGEAM